MRLLYFDSNLTEIIPLGPINDIPRLVQIMAWHLKGDWTNDGTVNRCEYESFDLFELNLVMAK